MLVILDVIDMIMSASLRWDISMKNGVAQNTRAFSNLYDHVSELIKTKSEHQVIGQFKFKRHSPAGISARGS